jgi:hypothetical protein
MYCHKPGSRGRLDPDYPTTLGQGRPRVPNYLKVWLVSNDFYYR